MQGQGVANFETRRDTPAQLGGVGEAGECQPGLKP